MKYLYAVFAGISACETTMIYAKTGADHILFAIMIGLTLFISLVSLLMSTEKTSV
ncbi:hypothetical protein [Priestia megaterium]|uniref:hypothetical protein n=1 Tax=Priestia megaterium TaxID=1404 RepID=UPI0032D8E392